MSAKGNYPVYTLTDFDSSAMKAIPMPALPNICVNIDPSTATPEQADYMLRSIQSVYDPPPATVEQTTDKYGTPLWMFQLEDTYDIEDERRSAVFGHNVSNMSLLAMRMKWGAFDSSFRLTPGEERRTIPFDHLTIHKSSDKHIIFLVVNGKPVTLEDNSDLFPSDALVTQLRMLADNKA